MVSAATTISDWGLGSYQGTNSSALSWTNSTTFIQYVTLTVPIEMLYQPATADNLIYLQRYQEGYQQGQQGQWLASTVDLLALQEQAFFDEGRTRFFVDETDKLKAEAWAKWSEWTEDQRAAKLAVIEQRTREERRVMWERLELAEQARLQQERRVIAQDKARIILEEHLTPAQLAQFRKDKVIDIETARAKYRIGYGHSGNITRFDKRGRREMTYCVHPADAYEIPVEDTMLAQLLHLRFAEAELERVANKTRAA